MIIVPEVHAEYAFEYKLGYEAGDNAAAVCPVKRSHLEPEDRQAAWWAGWKARRKALGKPQMRPMQIGRIIPRRAVAP